MKIIELFKNMLKEIKNSLKRFPDTICISTVCVILLIIISEIESEVSTNMKETLLRVTMVLALAIPISLCIKLFFERIKDYKKVSFYSAYVGEVILLIFYYYFFLKDFEMVSISRYIGVSIILYLVFLIIPYFSKKNGFELYVIKIFIRFLTTVVYSVILFLGLAAIFITIDKLLEINVKSEIYYYTWLSIAGVFVPSFFLAEIPENKDVLTLKDYPKIFRVLVVYIIIPLISVYTIILYIYFGKIIITRTWPQGLVSHLVLWYSVISAAVLFLISPLLNEKVWLRRYIKYFPKVILPLICMMFFSIGIRIRAYGVTENRYFVVMLGIWAFLVMIYFAFSNKFRNVVILTSLVIIIFVSILGPLSSYSISKYSQNKRLEKILIRNNMLKDNVAVKSNSDVSKLDAKNISSILNYFNENHSLKDVKVLPSEFEIHDMEKILNVKYTDEYSYNKNEYFYFNILESLGFIDISEYDYLFDSRSQKNKQAEDVDSFSINYDYQSGILKVNENGKEIYSKDLSDFATILVEKYGMNQTNLTLSQNEMIFEDENDKLKIKFVFLNMSGSKNISTGEIESKGLQFYVLIKKRN